MRFGAMFMVLAVMVPLFLAGCQSHPVIEDRLGTKIGTLAVSANYRLIVFDRATGRFCAEPPPDAMRIASWRRKVNLSSNSQQAVPHPLQGTLDLERAYASVAQRLLVRSQGLQFYRDGLYALCQLYLDGALDPMVLAGEVSALRAASMELIRQEIPVIRKQFPKDCDSPNVPSSSGEGP